MADVTLGDFDFDLADVSDFRLNVEGASGTGKSNTLAVILEDLADVQLPTLIIERLSILSSVRQEDDNLVVVGGRDEPGIDLTVPLESLDVVADMVLNRGMKVLLDVATYSSDDPNEHREHAATARVLKALNDDAQARLRSGKRRKALVVIDEVHYLAPERGAPHIDTTDEVNRARGQIVTMATEGGNKGLSVIISYQRRAYTSKGVVSQADNYVVHRLHKTDVGDAATEIGVSDDDIQELATGEAFIYGDQTNQRAVGPVTIRRRTSPDPRDGQFQLPEPPDELSDTLAEIGDQVADVQEERERQQSEIERLQDELDQAQDRIETLQDQAHISDILEQAVSGGDATAADMEEVAAEVDDLQARNEALQDDVAAKDDRIEALEADLAEAEREIEDLEAELADYRELDVVREDIVGSARSILRQLGAVDHDAEEMRQELDELRDERERLQDELDQARQSTPAPADGDDFEPLSDYRDFLEEDVVQEAIDEAKDKGSTRAPAIKATIASVIDNNGPATYDEIADRAGYSDTSHISSAATALEVVKVVRKLNMDGQKAVDLNTDGLNELRFAAKRREETDELIEDLPL